MLFLWPPPLRLCEVPRRPLGQSSGPNRATAQSTIVPATKTRSTLREIAFRRWRASVNCHSAHPLSFQAPPTVIPSAARNLKSTPSDNTPNPYLPFPDLRHFHLRWCRRQPAWTIPLRIDRAPTIPTGPLPFRSRSISLPSDISPNQRNPEITRITVQTNPPPLHSFA